MAGRHHLFVPGPTNIPDRILNAMHRPSIDHRSVEFPDLVKPILEATRRLFRTTTGEVTLFPASGTGGWEAALTNLVSPGDRVLLPCAGQFASLWAATARQLGLDVVEFDDLAWGEAPPADRIADTLSRDDARSIRGVLIVHNETSTGVTADLPAIREAIDASNHPALLLVDGVSSIASIPFEHQLWNVDVALTGSQKGLMLPAGLAVMAWSQRAVQQAQARQRRSAYFDLVAMLEQNRRGYFPYTPSIPLLYGLRESLTMLEEEGFESVFARHHRLADGVRAAVDAWQLRQCCRDPRRASDTVTTILVDSHIDAPAMIAKAHRRYHLALGAGLGPLQRHAFRIGHLGDLNEGMLLSALALTEMVLRDQGAVLELGSGVAAAQNRWLQ